VKRFDVAVVGAGPAGCSSAIFLARKGHSVALIERSLFPREKLCGDFLNPANWELFDKLGIRDAVLSLPHEKVGLFRISSASATAQVPFPRRNSRPFFGIGLRRSLFDDLLRRLAEKEGVEVRLGSKPKTLGRDSSGWTLTFGENSAEDKLHATVLIGADGRNSWVARRLGLAGSDRSVGAFVGFQRRLLRSSAAGGAVEIHLFPGGYGGLVGLGSGVATLCFIVDKDAAAENPRLEDLCRKYLRRNPNLREALERGEMVGEGRSVYPVFFSPRRSFGDSFLLVGDAARVTEPITGEGVYFALKSGELAAAAADRALKVGDVSARQLSSYSTACRRVLGVRQRVNRLVRGIVHRPYLTAPLLRMASRNYLPLQSLVNRVCQSAS